MPKLDQKFKRFTRLPFFGALQRQHPKAEVFLVGGAVRDILLGRDSKDFDFVVRNVAKPSLEHFLKRQGRVNLVGKRFGVFKFKPKNWNEGEIDIALPRTEHSLEMSGAYKDFKIKSKASLLIEDDLSRRDFTVNAMAVKIGAQTELVDPFHGQRDLKQKTIRTVGVAKHRFGEDYSRMLRAIRFSVQLNFKIDSVTRLEIRKNISKLNNTAGGQRIVPFEVIALELHKTLKANPMAALKLWDKLGAINVLLPELLKMKGCPQPRKFHKEGDVWRHTLLCFEKLHAPEFKKRFGSGIPGEVLWALLFHDSGKPATLRRAERLRTDGHDQESAKIFRAAAGRLKLSAAGVDVDEVEILIAKHMLLASADIPKMKATTIEKYFFNANFPGEKLLMVMHADVGASIHSNGKPNYTDYAQLERRLKTLRQGGTPHKLAKPLVDGNILMRELKLKPGPKIGKLLELLREAQLKGKIKTRLQALSYIKRYL